MKLTIERAAFLKSLSHVQSVVERRNTIPILSNVKLATEGGALALTATDMDLEIVERVPADVSVEGAVTAPALTLYDIVRKLPDGTQIELDTDGGDQLLLKAGRSRFRLGCLPVEEFPTMAEGEMPHSFSLNAGDLKRLIDRTRFAVSNEETRYYLNGIYLHTGATEMAPMLRAVATDGHRLARMEIALPGGADGIPGVIWPKKAVGEVRKLVDEGGDTVQIQLSENKIRFAFEGIVLTTKLIDGTFPDYERVIPVGNDKRLEVDADSFASAVDRVSTISSEKSRAVKLSMENNTVTLSATGAENGSATEELESMYDADKIEIGFNSRYLLDIVNQIGGEQAQFHLADAASPTLVRDVDDPGALFVLMPMRV